MALFKKHWKTASTIVLVLMLTCLCVSLWLTHPFLYHLYKWLRENNTAAADKIAILTVLVGLFAAIAGAKYGAKAAFDLGHKQQMQDLEDRRYSALITTQSAFISQWNIIEGIRQDNLEPLRADAYRFVKLPLMYVPDVAVRVPMNDIIFIAEPGKKDSPESRLANPDLLLKIHIAERAYTAVIETVALFRKEKEIFNTKYTGISNPVPEQEDLHVLKHYADWLYKHVDSSLVTIHEANIETGKDILKRFPGRGILALTALGAQNK
jgi:hypothetical protein